MQCIPFLITSFIMALGISLYTVPVVIRITHSLKLLDKPNERSAAKIAIPTLGGIAIFLSFIFASLVGLSGDELPELVYIYAAIILMFFVGLKDDILTLSWWKKLIAQLITAVILIFPAKIRFTNLHGFFGIESIGIVPGALLTIFVIIVIINAFNLMDGIDGLAGGLSMLAGFVFGIWFFISGHYDYAIISASLVGAISGFFYFNLYGKKNKIFMGDTGSLVLGTIMSIIVIRFNELNIDPAQTFAVLYAPAISFSILIYPLADTLRVFTIRALQLKSPFTADKNHLHHRLLTLGFSHQKATYTIIAMNLLFILSVFSLQHLGMTILIGLIVVMSSFLFMLPAYFIRRGNMVKENDPHQQLLFPGTFSQLIKNRKNGRVLSPQRPASRALNLRILLQKLNIW